MVAAKSTARIYREREKVLGVGGGGLAELQKPVRVDEAFSAVPGPDGKIALEGMALGTGRVAATRRPAGV